MSKPAYKPYPAYKDSGVEWIGEIPEGWEIKKIKHIKSQIPNAFVDGPFGSNLKSQHYVDNGEVYVVESGFITSGEFRIKKFKTISEEHFHTISRSECKYNDIIIAKIGAGFGMSGILPKLDKKSVVSGNSLKLTLESKITSTRFIHYQLLTMKNNGVFDLIVNATAQPALSLGLLNEIKQPSPPVQEQTQIATFLDKKTSQIDTLIKKKKRLNDLLKEEREAIINHAVTKGLPAAVAAQAGLDPKAKMKDSGVEWIGEIPEGWDISSFRWHIIISSGEGLSNHFIKLIKEKEELYKVIGGNGVMGYSSLINTESKAFAIGRVGALCGNVHFIDEKCWITDNALKISKWNNFFDGYLYYILYSANLNEYANKNAQPLITGEQVKGLKVTLPPLKEQTQIANFLDKKTSQIDKTITNNEKEIELLTEYRAALISEAVTGKIDVRGFV